MAMGTPTAGSRRACPRPPWRRTSNKAGNGSRSCRTTAPSSGSAAEQDDPDLHFREELGGRETILLGQDHLAERMAFGELREDEFLQSPDREGVGDRNAATGFARGIRSPP